MTLADTHRTLHATAAKYIDTLFCNTHKTFSKMGHVLGHRTVLNTRKKVDIIPYIFSCHYNVKLETGSKRKTGIFTNMWKLNSSLLNSQLGDSNPSTWAQPAVQQP